MYEYNGTTCTQLTYSSGPPTNTGIGAYGKFAYDPGLDVFTAAVNSGGNDYVLNLNPSDPISGNTSIGGSVISGSVKISGGVRTN